LTAGTSDELAAAQTALTEETSLAGIAHVIPTPPTQRSDGAFEVRIYAVFKK